MVTKKNQSRSYLNHLVQLEHSESLKSRITTQVYPLHCLWQYGAELLRFARSFVFRHFLGFLGSRPVPAQGMLAIIRCRVFCLPGCYPKTTKIYRTIILTVVFYGCETWSLTLREERRLRVFENRVLRRIFGPKRDEVTG